MVLGLEFATREFLEYVFFCKFELRICVVTGITQLHSSVLLLILQNDNSQRVYCLSKASIRNINQTL